MKTFSQGEIVKVEGYRQLFLVISKNAYIKATGHFHICPLLADTEPGPLHIPVSGKKGESGTALCENIKLIDPKARACLRVDRIPYDTLMDISDAIQGIFEYD